MMTPQEKPTPVEDNTLGTNLRLLRHRARMSMTDVAKATGIRRATQSEYEHGRHKPSADKLKAYAKLYGVSMDDLMDRPLAKPCPRCEGVGVVDA